MAASVLGSISSSPISSFSSTSPKPAIIPISVASGRKRPRIFPHCTGLRVSLCDRKLRSALVVDTSKANRLSSAVCRIQEGTVDEKLQTAVPDVSRTTWRSLVLECDKTVIVEFWASWCEPCHSIHPLIAKLSAEFEGKMRCFKINTDENPEIATQYGIRSIPTIVIFKNGEKVEKLIGAVPETTLLTFVREYLDI